MQHSIKVYVAFLALFLGITAVTSQTVVSREFAPVSLPCARIRFSRVFNLNTPSNFGDVRFDRLVLQGGTSTLDTPRASDWQVQLRGLTTSFPAVVYTPSNSRMSLRIDYFGASHLIIKLRPTNTGRVIRLDYFLRHFQNTNDRGLLSFALLEFRGVVDRMAPPNNPGATDPTSSIGRTATVTSSNVCYNLVSTDRPVGA